MSDHQSSPRSQADKEASQPEQSARPSGAGRLRGPHHKIIGWLVAALIVLSFSGGVIGGLLGLTVLSDTSPFKELNKREVLLQESSVIIDVVEKISPSVVSITVEGQPTQIGLFSFVEPQSSAGTGIVINKDGLILTNKHIFPDNPKKITVVTAQGKEYRAKLLAREPVNDLAYLRVQSEDELQPAVLGDSDQVVVGQRVIAVGNALGEFKNTVTSGIISGIGRPIVATDGASDVERLADLFQTDAAINPGNSGGPLVNVEGQVIGVNTATAGNAENIGFAIPINQAKAGIASVQEEGELIKPYLGVRYVMLTPEFAAANNLSVTEGAYVAGSGSSPAILPDSPADQAGIRSGDIITHINDEAVNQERSLVTLINKYEVGETVQVSIVRGETTKVLDVTLAELPANP